IEAGLADALAIERLAALPPLQRARERAHGELVEPERLADVADRAARPIRDDRGRDRGTLARVLARDILNDLLAALVPEVDIDVGRLVALLRYEALDEHLHARGVDLRDAEHEADDGIRGRAAALAENPLAARELHDVVHGQEIRLVAQLGDELELVLDEPL